MNIFEAFERWLDCSNRRIHAYGGLAILLAMIPSGLLMGINFIPLAVEITIATFMAMVYIDMKDKQQGNKFDWMDVLAGMIPCISMWLGIGVDLLIKAIV